jgi:hypothetical protein
MSAYPIRPLRPAHFDLLDEIADGAETNRHCRISARLLGRVLAIRLGLRVFDAQRVAKAWQSDQRRKAGTLSAGIRRQFGRSGHTPRRRCRQPSQPAAVAFHGTVH